MIHPDTELRFISPEIGFGIVATRLIPKGTIIWVFDSLDEVVTPAAMARMHPLQRAFLNKYGYRDHTGDYVLCGDHARFVNHSFNSSCMSTAYNCELAIRDIHPGEELTDDYGYLNPSEPFDVVPEPGSRRSRVLPDDLLNFHPQWDAQLRATFPFVSQVDQPLLPLLDEESMESILSCYYPGPTSQLP
jgi:hypothetical protein